MLDYDTTAGDTASELPQKATVPIHCEASTNPLTMPMK
jgi:hypothetical protein